MNAFEVRRLVREAVPAMTDDHIEPTRDGFGLYFHCSLNKLRRAMFIEIASTQSLLWGMSASVEKSDKAIAAEITQGLKA